MGEALYTQVLFFANLDWLLSQQFQNRIKEYLFCKTFNCPPSSSLQDTPVEIIDDFMIIDEEYNLCQEEQNNKVNK